MLSNSFSFRGHDYTPDRGLDRHGFLVSTAYAGHGAGQLRGFGPVANTAATKTPTFARMVRMISGIARSERGLAEALSGDQKRTLGMLPHRLHS